MTIKPWVAIDATASPVRRVCKLRQLWGEYFSERRLDRVRQPIADSSWHRSEVAGIDASRTWAPTLLADRRDVHERWQAHMLQAAPPSIRRWLGPVAVDSKHLIVVSDAEGLLLRLDSDARFGRQRPTL